jgi:hypothetical protein
MSRSNTVCRPRPDHRRLAGPGFCAEPARFPDHAEAGKQNALVCRNIDVLDFETYFTTLFLR